MNGKRTYGGFAQPAIKLEDTLKLEALSGATAAEDGGMSSKKGRVANIVKSEDNDSGSEAQDDGDRKPRTDLSSLLKKDMRRENREMMFRRMDRDF